MANSEPKSKTDFLAQNRLSQSRKLSLSTVI